MKTAEDVAKEISDYCYESKSPALEKEFAKLIEAYGKERVNVFKQVIIDEGRPWVTKMIAKARAEALEEAAKYIEYRASIIRGDWNGPDLLNQSAHEIRALKDKP